MNVEKIFIEFVFLLLFFFGETFGFLEFKDLSRQDLT